MSRKARDERTLRHVASLRRAERGPEVAEEIRVVRRDLERELGPTVRRSVAARLLGVSQTALDRWTAVGEVPTVLTPTGRTEVPRRVVIELMAAVDQLKRAGSRRPLGAALRQRRAGVLAVVDTVVEDLGDATPHGHARAERRSLARHRIIAKRLDARLVDDARERLDELVEQGLIHPTYERPWRHLLARPLPEIARVITADTQEGRDLRQNSPFRGGVTEPERRRILELEAVRPGYTQRVKTGISLPDATFERVERAAKDLGVSRSEFFARAAERWLDALDDAGTTEAIDEAIDGLERDAEFVEAAAAALAGESA